MIIKLLSVQFDELSVHQCEALNSSIYLHTISNLFVGVLKDKCKKSTLFETKTLDAKYSRYSKWLLKADNSV
jgi:hypothetical protein